MKKNDKSNRNGQRFAPAAFEFQRQTIRLLRFLSNTGPDPLKNHTATKLAFNVEMAFRWWAENGMLFSGIWILTFLQFNKSEKNKQKNVELSWTPSEFFSGSAHVVCIGSKFDIYSCIAYLSQPGVKLCSRNLAMNLLESNYC